MHIEILLEEESMDNVLTSILQHLQNDYQFTYRTHVHGGKSVLLKKLPTLLRGYGNWILKPGYENYVILIVLDQDQDDCIALKKQIADWCDQNNLSERTKIRIVVTMLEAWFFGDPVALEKAFPKLAKQRISTKSTYRNPETRPDPARDLDREMREAGYGTGYMKISHSREIAKYMTINDKNRCNSFAVTVSAIRDLVAS